LFAIVFTEIVNSVHIIDLQIYTTSFFGDKRRGHSVLELDTNVFKISHEDKLRLARLSARPSEPHDN
jgi:hypothetical protein